MNMFEKKLKKLNVHSEKIIFSYQQKKMLALQISYSGEKKGIFCFHRITYFCEYFKNMFEKMGKSKTCIMKH